jgi:cation diffusion facilitator CzcD-associated flavoprotein CzcO
MLQRSPSYMASLPSSDPLVGQLRRMLPHRAVYAVVRWKNVLLQLLSYQLSRRWPRLAKALIRRSVTRALPAGFDVDTHFNPTYDPWDQRLCLVPDHDLFEAIAAGRAEMITDRIATFTETGVALESGRELEADLIVTATGLNLLFVGGIEVVVDGAPVDLPSRFTYRGMMLNDVPNFAFTVGYTNASWTLKADLVAEYVCRLLAHMDANGYRSCQPELADDSVTVTPLLDFTSGYVVRSLHLLPKQGSRPPWRLRQNYPLDLATLRLSRIEDGTMRFSRGAEAGAAGSSAELADPVAG